MRCAFHPALYHATAGFGLVTTNALFKVAHYRERGYNLGAGQRSDVRAFGCDTGLRATVRGGYGWREPSRAEQASQAEAIKEARHVYRRFRLVEGAFREGRGSTADLGARPRPYCDHPLRLSLAPGYEPVGRGLV